LLLCGTHHRLVHEGGFRIVRNYQDQWVFTRPDGIAVPACGYQKADTQDAMATEISSADNYPSREGFLSKSENTQINLLRSQLNDRFPRKQPFN